MPPEFQIGGKDSGTGRATQMIHFTANSAALDFDERIKILLVASPRSGA